MYGIAESYCSSAIAIVGVSCRLPGGAHDPGKLWDLLVEGKNVWSRVPEGRYHEETFFHPFRGANGAHTHRGGHFLDQDIGAFDAGFFGISAEEATAMDPQQRLQMEIAYEALENAGIKVESIQGSDTGVYVAIFNHDYENIVYKDALSIPKYFMTGVGPAIVSNRISYTFDLKGPSMTIDTGCSGSLVALHQACQSLRCGETSMCLVGGTNLILNPDAMIPMDGLHLLNSDGRCYSFDSRGSGYGRGEGVTMVVIKRLKDALLSGDPIRTIIRNTAVGQDGKTPGITYPSGAAQQQLIRLAYKSMSLNPSDVGYIEAHGTGTVAGDLTEMDAIQNVFCNDRKYPVYVGSIKANVGHLESASGLAGVIKAMLVLEKGIIPSVPNLKSLKRELCSLSSGINVCLADGGLRPAAYLSRYLKPLVHGMRAQPNEQEANIVKNSFGYGGANAHAIIEAPSVTAMLSDFDLTADNLNQSPLASGEQPRTGLQLLVVTAKSKSSLEASLRNLHSWVHSRKSSLNVADLAYTLALRRSLMHWRYTFVASTHEMISVSLQGEPFKTVRTAKTHRLIYIFGGQGGQWFAMGRELLQITCFRSSLAECASILKELGASWDLFEELTRHEAESQLDRSDFGQPITTALQVALVELLASLRLWPNAVLGHSSGEIAAAYAAGALSKPATMRLSYHRGFLAARCRSVMENGGAMLAVALGKQEVSIHMDRVGKGRIGLACNNGPMSTTVSGDSDAIDELQNYLNRSSITSRKLNIDTAYHSHHMLRVAKGYLRDISDLEVKDKNPAIDFYSCVTGNKKNSDFGPSYWVDNLISVVHFREALESMAQNLHQDSAAQNSICHNFVEIGPHMSITPLVKQTLKSLKLDDLRYQCTYLLEKGTNAHLSFLRAIGHLFEHGYPIDVNITNSIEGAPGRHNVLTDLPPYPFDHSISYWHESRLLKDHRLRRQPYHDLLGSRLAGDTLLQPRWRQLINTQSLPWLRDHTVDGCIVFPASGYVVQAVEAITQIYYEWPSNQESKIQQYVLKDIVFINTLEILEPTSVEVVTTLQLAASNTGEPCNSGEFRVSSVSFDGTVKEHCYGSISLKLIGYDNVTEIKKTNSKDHTANEQIQHFYDVAEAGYPKFDPRSVYKQMRSNGHHWGPDFAGIKNLRAGDSDAIGTITVPDIARSMPGNFMQPHTIHPATLDSMIHSSLILLAKSCGKTIMFPVAMGEVLISSDGLATPNDELDFVTSLLPEKPGSVVTTITAFRQGPSGPQMLVHIRDARIRWSTNRDVDREEQFTKTCYELKWDIDLDLCEPPVPPKDGALDKPRGQRQVSLNQLAYRFVAECLDNVDIGDIEGKYQKYFCWMKQFVSLGQSKTTEEHNDNLSNCISDLGVEGEALHRIGSNLASIMAGKADPLSLLLEGDLLYRLYAEEAGHVRCYTHLVDYLKRIAFKRPRIRILEVGAGTGGASVPVLRALQSSEGSLIERYDFTDVSSGFFEDARRKLSEWRDYLSFRTLDIGRDPIQQGFNEGTYDVVLASNALHTAQSIDDALMNVRRLLKPNGKLMLIELTTLVPYMNAIFGLLPGWYGERHDGRQGPPVLSVEQWRSRLNKGGFTGVNFSVPDFGGAAQQITFMTSKIKSLASPLEDVRIVLDKGHESTKSVVHQKLAKFIESQGGFVEFQKTPLHKIEEDELYIIFSNNIDHVITETVLQQSGLTDNPHSPVNVIWIPTLCDASTPTYASRDETQILKPAINTKKGLNLVTLRICQSTQLDYLYSMVYNILDASFRSSANIQSFETEYFCANGVIQIPRIISSNQLRQKLRRATQPVNSSVRPRLDRTIGMNDASKVGEQLSPGSRFDGPVDNDDLEVKVYAWDVDFRAVPTGPTWTAGQFSGRVINAGSEAQKIYRVGDEVCCWGFFRYSTYCRVAVTNVCQLPGSMSFATAASLPMAFSTAYHGLVQLADLKRKQRILINDNLSGTGIAAARISEHLGADALLLSSSESHIGAHSSAIRSDSMDCDIDVALSVKEHLSSETIYTRLKPFGKYIYIGTPNSPPDHDLATACSQKNIVCYYVTFEALLKYAPEKIKQYMEILQSWDDVAAFGSLRSAETYDLANVANIHHSMERESLITKKALSSDQDSVDQDTPMQGSVQNLRYNATYLLVGDLGQWGLTICRYLARRMARYVAFLPWSTPEVNQLKMFEKELQRSGIEVRVVLLGSSDLDVTKESIFHALEGWPAVRGILQADLLQQDRRSEHAATKFQMAEGQALLANIFKGLDLDFFVTISTCASLFNSQREEISNMFVETETDSTSNRMPHRISLLVGGSREFDLVAEHPNPHTILCKQGLFPMSANELNVILDHVTGTDIGSDSSNVMVTGLDALSLNDDQRHALFSRPIWNHVRQHRAFSKEQRTDTSLNAVEEDLATALNEEDARRIVIAALQQKIGSVTFDFDTAELQTPIADFGMDSLVVFQLRTWISRRFSADVEPQEVSRATSIIFLTNLILQRTSLIQYNGGLRVDKNPQNVLSVTEPNIEALASETLPRQPLPLLSESLQRYLDAARSWCSDEEFAVARRAVEDFGAPNAMGQLLHDRLISRAEDPQIENWLGDLYADRRFLSLRNSLVATQSYFGTHPVGDSRTKPAEKAALITLAVRQFKTKVQNGELDPQSLFGRTVDSSSYRRLFNTCRQPCTGLDRICTYDNDDYIVVMRRGHIFRVDLIEGEHSQLVSLKRLERVFEMVIEATPDSTLWSSVLTVDDRDQWATVREDLTKISEANKLSLQTIEAAAFVVCLDDAQPKTSTERFRHFLFGDGTNRWYDKTLQIIVCGNGISATVYEHAAIDAITTKPLHDAINRAIMHNDPSRPSASDNQDVSLPVNSVQLPLSLTPILEKHVLKISQSLAIATSKYSFAHLKVLNFGNDFFSTHKCPVQSGLQLAIQLASRRFYGYSPPALETVSMATFLKGRVEVHHIISSPVMDFLKAADSPRVARDTLRTKAFEAAKAHAKSLSKASKGHGFSRHLLAMEWMLRPGEARPALFDDPIYARMKPGKVITSTFESGWVEGGFVYPVPESILLYVDVQDSSVSFSIFGNTVNAEDFRSHLKATAQEIRTLLS